MQKTIAVAGATGNLGGKIIKALLAKDANVIALVRRQTDERKIGNLKGQGVTVKVVDMTNPADLSKSLEGVDCVVSALAGLRETIVDTQKILLDAAVKAGVPRFIPSDYSNDFTNLVEGQNRNFDLRREFHRYLDTQPIQATSIFNGPFMDLLTSDMPLILPKQKRILCWGSPDQPIEFTTTLNIAEFTANAALDMNTPRYLKIAGDILTCRDFVSLLTSLTGNRYRLFRPGGIGMLNFMIKLAKFFSPSLSELYPAWQGMQYMRDMMEGRIIFPAEYDNDCYPGIEWTSVKEFLVREGVGR